MRRLATFTAQGELDDAAIFVRGNVVEWVGRDAELPAALSKADTVLELRDHVMIPGMSSSILCELVIPRLLTDLSGSASACVARSQGTVTLREAS